MSYYGFSEYVPVAKRKENAKKLIKKLEKKGQKLNPISIEGRIIAKSFWGKGWCTHLDTMNDFESICNAVNLVIEHRGGVSFSNDDLEMIVPLPVAGIMSNEDGYKVAEQYSLIDKAVKEAGSTLGL